MKREHLEDYVKTIPDFPQKGIMFRDITSLIQDPDGLQDSINGLIKSLEGVEFDTILGLESRGFVFGTAVAYAMHKGFVLVRKRASCRGRQYPQNMILSMDRRRLKFTRMPFVRASGS